MAQNRKPCPLLLLLIMTFVAGSCSREQEVRYPDIQLPPTPAVNLQTNWGLITSSHLRLREKPATDAKALSTLWRGSILEILSQTATMENVEGADGYWYRISFDGLQGWVFGGYLEIYPSREEAERAAMEIRN